MNFTFFIAGITCLPLELNVHVLKSCTDGDNHGSRCTFSVEVGYELEGPPSSTCGGSATPGDWSHPSPIAVCKYLPYTTKSILS